MIPCGTYYKFFLNSNDPGRVRCYECKEIIQDREAYKVHLQIVHGLNEWRMVFCPHCPNKYVDMENAIIHLLFEH